MSSFHKTKLGRFGENLTADMDGYVHTTIAGWMSANVDCGSETMTRTQLRDWAREQAAESRKQLVFAERGVAEWQSR
jgi:hypothetical protein